MTRSRTSFTVYSALAIPGLLLSAAAPAQQEIQAFEGSFAVTAPDKTNRHSIDVEAGQTIEVIVRGNGIDTELNARLPNGEMLYNDDYDGFDAGFVRTFARAGTLQVEASPLSSGETGPYRVVVNAMPPAAGIGIGDVVTERLTAASGDRYTLAGREGQRVLIDLKSYDFDATLTLNAADGSQLTDDDGGDEGYNSRLQYMFPADGSVTITAGSLGSTGRYELSVAAMDSEQVAQYDGALEVSDRRAYDGKLYDVYEIDGEAGAMLSVTLESNAFDTVVHVSNPDGTNLGSNDDGPDGTNSELLVRFRESGTHEIYVTALSDGTGTYRLTVFK